MLCFYVVECMQAMLSIEGRFMCFTQILSEFTIQIIPTSLHFCKMQYNNRHLYIAREKVYEAFAHL